MGRIRRFRDGFKRLTPRREWIYEYEQCPYDCYEVLEIERMTAKKKAQERDSDGRENDSDEY